MNEIWIYDDIGPDWLGLVSGKYVINELSKFKGKPVTVRINSPGGDVIEAQAIYNALRRHSDGGGEVTIEVDALAASAASHIAMAGDTIRMAEDSMMMVHRTWTIALGNAGELRAAADVIEKMDLQLIDLYSARTGQDKSKVESLVDEETWMTANEAVDLGFADEIGTALKVKASVKSGRFNKTPPEMIGEHKREVARASRIEQVRQQIRISRARAGV